MKIQIKPIFLFPLVVLALLLGISGGWVRLGNTEWLVPHAASLHGIWMVGGFLGTLIALERAMVMKNKIWLLVPFISGMSVPLMVAGWASLGTYALLVASLGLVAIMYFQTLKHQVVHQFIMSLGAVFWLVGNFSLIHSGLVAAATPWWIGFILFTIIGERLELSKFLPTPRWAKKGLNGLLLLFLLGMWLPFHRHGNWIMGAAAIFISFWLLHFDMAKIASKKSHQFKYIGIGLRVGYVWLTLNGIILLFLEQHALYYDLYLHTFFLGFTFSMIWAHAPIILPMVLNIKESPYHGMLWPFWILFQVSLLGRVLTSLTGMGSLRTIFGVVNGWSIVLLFVMMAGIVLVKVLTGKFKRNAIISIEIQATNLVQTTVDSGEKKSLKSKQEVI